MSYHLNDLERQILETVIERIKRRIRLYEIMTLPENRARIWNMILDDFQVFPQYLPQYLKMPKRKH
jgi:hypothetical protein